MLQFLLLFHLLLLLFQMVYHEFPHGKYVFNCFLCFLVSGVNLGFECELRIFSCFSRLPLPFLFLFVDFTFLKNLADSIYIQFLFCLFWIDPWLEIRLLLQQILLQCLLNMELPLCAHYEVLTILLESQKLNMYLLLQLATD